MMGTLHHQLLGKVTFKDEENGLTGYLEIGKNKKSTKDAFTGYIMARNGQKLCNIEGNYMGYMDFDGQRYFDLREQDVREVKPLDINKCLESDSRLRIDLVELARNDEIAAQENKDFLEVTQRRDRDNREAAQKRREKNGPKFQFKKQTN